MKYQNKKTGAIIDIAFTLKGDDWEPVKKQAPKKVEEPKEDEAPEVVEIAETEPVKKAKSRSKKK